MGSIRKRGQNSYELTVDRGRDAQGRRRRSYESFKGSAKEAKSKLRKLEHAADLGISANSGKVTVGEWLDRWFREYVAVSLSPTTADRYELTMRLHVKPAIGHIRLAELSPADVRTFEAMLRQKMKPGSVGYVHNVLSGALTYALREEVLGRNVASVVTPPREKETHEVQPPDVDGVVCVLSYIREHGPRYYALCYLLATTGLRHGEALGLNWDGIDLGQGTLRVSQGLVRTTARGHYLQAVKTKASRRTINLDPDTVEVLRAHQGEQMLIKATLGSAYQDQGLVFAGATGGFLSLDAMRKGIISLSRRAGVTIKPHAFRHFHATVMLQAGQNPLVVRDRLGHSSIQMTQQIYGHTFPSWDRAAADDFGALLRDHRQQAEDHPVGEGA